MCSTTRRKDEIRPPLIGRQRRDAFLPRTQVGEPVRKRRPHAAGRFRGSGEFRRVRVPSTIIGTDGSRFSFSATATPTAVCGSMKRLVSRSKVRMVAGGLVFIRPVGPLRTPRGSPRARAPRKGRSAATGRARPSGCAPRARRGHRRRTTGARNSTPPGCPSTARRSAPPFAARRRSGARPWGEDVVDVGGDQQAVDRQPHVQRDEAGIDVAEIAGRHRSGDLAVGASRARPRR